MNELLNLNVAIVGTNIDGRLVGTEHRDPSLSGNGRPVLLARRPRAWGIAKRPALLRNASGFRRVYSQLGVRELSDEIFWNMLGDATLGIGHSRSARRPDVNARRPGVYEMLGVRGVLTSGTSYCAPAPAERRTLSSRLNTPAMGG